jgi:hypothetical protein
MSDSAAEGRRLGTRSHARREPGVLIAFLGLVLLSGGIAAADTPTPGGRLAEPTGSFDSFLDSLRTGSDTVSDEGVRSEWPVADSLASLIITEGPSFAAGASAFHTERRLDIDFRPEFTSFNRVEGLRLGGEADLSFGRTTLAVGVARGLSNGEWRHREELRLDAGRYGTFRGGFADLIVPYGAPPIPGNGVYAFLGGADDQDYLKRRGAQVEWQLGEERRLVRVGYAVTDERSVEATTDWNLFDRDRGPRPNPPIVEGRARRLAIEAGVAAVAHPLRGARLHLRGAAEIAGYGLGGDYEYDRYRLDLESDWHALGRDDLSLTLAVGGARNLNRPAGGSPRPAPQSLFYLGGPAALRAYPVNTFRGDRFAFGSLDYLVGTDLLARIGIGWAQIQLVPFFEIGAAWFDDNGRGLFSSPDSGDWRSDAGLGLQRNVLAGITARLDLAFRLDREEDRLTTRLGFRMPLFDRFDSE